MTKEKACENCYSTNMFFSDENGYFCLNCGRFVTKNVGHDIFLVNEDMLMWAFRYALGRKTGAVSSVVNHLKVSWDRLRPFTQDQIQREINIAIDRGDAGDDCDIELWRELL